MTSARSLTVKRKFRDEPISDIPINFPPLQNLHLELLEIKEKLKPGLPLIPRSKPKITKPTLPPPAQIPQIQASPPVSIIANDATTSGNVSNVNITKSDTTTGAAVVNKDNKKVIIKDSDGEESVVDTDEEEDVSSPKEMIVPDKPAVSLETPFIPKESIVLKEIPVIKEEINPKTEEEINSTTEEEEVILSPEEAEAKEKEEYIWRFRILKKQYQNANIPIFNEHSDLLMMKRSYDRTIKELYLDDAIETYRTYLFGGWLVMEYVCTQWIGIDLSGFAKRQSQMMNKYDRMLIELGEKSYTRWGNNFPVEVRLIFVIVFQAGLFYLAKMIGENFGESFVGLLNGGQQKVAVLENDEVKKMQGPKIKASDIRNRVPH